MPIEGPVGGKPPYPRAVSSVHRVYVLREKGVAVLIADEVDPGVRWASRRSGRRSRFRLLWEPLLTPAGFIVQTFRPPVVEPSAGQAPSPLKAIRRLFGDQEAEWITTLCA